MTNMKCTIPEISWHNRDPVLSVDLQPVPNENFYRLASGGTDTHVLIWYLKILDNGTIATEPVCDLTRHQKAVNVVRWSPSAQYLASGDDDANVIIWHQKKDELSVMLDSDTSNKENWSLLKVLRGHKEDVYDISWSPNSLKLISGSVDNTAIVWDLVRGLNENILTDHKGFVQGVSWDPLGQYLATLCSDRLCRIFNETGSKVKSRISKGTLPVPEGHALHGETVRYYHDDTFKSYFRRLSFSPDGSILVTPAGYLETWKSNKSMCATYVFNMNAPSQPAIILQSPKEYTTAVRFCPILFELWSEGPESVIPLPYRMVFAVATKCSIVLYDTQQMAPYAVLSNIHYTRLTDITWSYNGRLLVVSSTDGYCSLVTFKPEELGKEYVREENNAENVDECSELETSLKVTNENIEEKEKKSSFLQKWTMKLQKDITKEGEIHKSESRAVSKEVDKVIFVPNELEPSNKENTKSNQNTDKKVNVLTPRSKKQSTAEQILSKNPEASPIPVKKKPRIEQMNIKNYFVLKESPKGNSADKKDSDPIIMSYDSVAHDTWNSPRKDTESEPEIVLVENPCIKDNQNMKLVLEDNEDAKEECSKLSAKEIKKIIIGDCSKNGDSADAKPVTKKAQPVLPSIAAISNSSTVKKRVSFMTLSSPKNKKFTKRNN